MARRIHLFPCRTQKLSFLTPRVVGGKLPARVGSRRAKWRISSAGRASALQAGGHRFEPCILHIESLAQLVEQRTFNPWVEGSSPSRLMTLYIAGVAELADALDLGSSVFGRVGSSPTTRIANHILTICRFSSVGRASVL